MAYGKNALKGKWMPRNPQKYKGNVRNITYRSSWELKFMNWCDTRSNIVQWSSEETVIPYKSPIDGLAHRYFVDFKFVVQNQDGSHTTFLAEVKPLKYTKEPVKRSRTTKTYLEDCVMWETNKAKWEAANTYCAKRGWRFVVVTEKTLGIKT